VSWIVPLLVSAAIVLIETLIGGTRLVFSLPAYAVLAAAGFAAAFDGRVTQRPSRICFVTTVAVFAYLLVRAWSSPVAHLARADVYSMLACILGYALASFRLCEPRARGVVLWAIFALAVAEVLIGLRQFSVGDNWMPFGFIRADYQRRASGTLISSIHLAGYLEVVGLFALSMAFWSRWRLWTRWAAGYVSVLCYLGVVITGSRGGYVSALVGLAALAVMGLWVLGRTQPEFLWRRAVFGLALVVAAAALVWTFMRGSPMLRERVALLSAQFEPDKLDVRVYNWQAALDQARLSPWTGTGAGTHLYFGRYFRRAPLQHDPEHAHSDFLELLAEYGCIGLAGMLLLVIVHLARGLETVSKIVAETRGASGIRSDTLAVTVGALAAMAAYAAHSLVDFNLHIPGHALLFSVIFGWLAGGRCSEVDGRRFWFGGVESLGRWIPAVCALAVVVVVLPRWLEAYWAEKARVALRNREFARTVEMGRRALEWGPLNPDVHFYLGEACRAQAGGTALVALRSQLFGQAVEAYQKSLAEFVQNENAWARLGQALDGLGRFEDADGAYRRALELDPLLGVLHLYYSKHLEARGNVEDALRVRERGLRLKAGGEGMGGVE